MEWGETDRVVEVLAEAFAGYPVLRHVLGDREDLAAHRRLVWFFTTARFMKGEPVIGLYDGEELAAAALISFPGQSTSPPELRDVREAVWEELGVTARARYEEFTSAAGQFDVDVPHAHLNMIGVRRAMQGKRLGPVLMDEVHRVSKADPRSHGVTLTTEVARNVPFYERLGYQLLGHTRITPALESWSFFRPD